MKKFYFTFGFGQVHQGCFTIIEAEDSDIARAIMNKRFGQKWSMQYTDAGWFNKEGISQQQRFDLKEIK